MAKDDNGNTALHRVLSKGAFGRAYKIAKKFCTLEIPPGAFTSNKIGQSLHDCFLLGKVACSEKFVLNIIVRGCMTEDDDRAPIVNYNLCLYTCLPESDGSFWSPRYSFEYNNERYSFSLPMITSFGPYCFDVIAEASKLRELEGYIRILEVY